MLIPLWAAAGIPLEFHGTWSVDDAACADPAEVRMIIDENGYWREEIGARVLALNVLDAELPRIRLTLSASAEGWSWTSEEEWALLGTAQRLEIRDVGESHPTHYVRCTAGPGRNG